MDRDRRLRHNAEAEEGTKEFEHLEVSWTARRWIYHVTVTIGSMIIPVV